MPQASLNIQDDSNDRKYFTIIPNYILNHSTLYDREVYIQMKRVAGDNNKCWMSIPNLAKQCGMSDRRLQKSIKYLLEHHWIEEIVGKIISTRGGSQKVRQFKVVDLWKMNIDFYIKGGECNAPPKPKGGERIEPKVVNQVHPKKITIKEEPIIATLGVADPINPIIELFKMVNPSYKRLFSNKTERESLSRLLKEHGTEKITEVIKILEKTNVMEYAPVITTPYKLEKKLGDLVAFINKEKLKLSNPRVVKI